MALTAFYHSTGGDNWVNNTNWLSDKPLREWHGVDTDENDRVVALRLYGNNLQGTIPAALASLTKLEILHLRDNQLNGQLPQALGSAPELVIAYLAGSNQFSGCMPEGLRNLWAESHDLFDLGLPFCGLTDGHRADRAALIALYNSTNGPSWRHSDHWLSEPTPVDFWYGVETDNSGRVVELRLEGLRGEIPSELGNLSELRFLWLGYELTGKIPYQLGNLANLEVMWLPQNMLSGQIPPALGNLENLQSLELQSNQLSGGIPPELGRLTNLIILRLWDNHLEGSIPQELGRMPHLDVLHIGGTNRFTGCKPRGFHNIRSNDFTSLELPFCNDDGTVP